MTYSVFRPHPWHGLSVREDSSSSRDVVNAYIEITPFDGIKYEIDKASGYLRVDRPQLTSSLPPALYGFIPQTFCGDEVAKLARQIEKSCQAGDRDPLDILVISERQISRNEVIAPARVIGGIRMIDKSEADDKIIAVLESDPYWKSVNDLSELPLLLIQRIEHYFSTYKMVPGQTQPVQLAGRYGKKEALQVIEASIIDYQKQFPKT